MANGICGNVRPPVLRGREQDHDPYPYPVLLLALALPATAQNTVTVSTAAGNAEQVWYSLQNGEVATAALADWDLAFETAGFTASIRVNTQKGMRVFKAPYAVQDWASLDTTGMLATWKEVHDSDTSWSHGALNDGLTSNEFDLGWGVYNQVTHIVAGDSAFVLQLANGDWKKLPHRRAGHRHLCFHLGERGRQR